MFNKYLTQNTFIIALCRALDLLHWSVQSAEHVQFHLPTYCMGVSQSGRRYVKVKLQVNRKAPQSVLYMTLSRLYYGPWYLNISV